ncbi:DoxX-like family protein [Lacinutrix sp.]|uniref:DoxX-like family protein n=1 Tax=Lacinutrix sp. TaxID=1937692 RepID=UPI0025C08DAB|nr:DoxX-like family protein [Lacinutrix sp.]
MKHPILHNIITVFIALVWLINGLYSKVLNQVPRHEAIVAKILNTEHSRIIIITIGILEVCMAIWILIKYKQKLNAIIQIVIVLTMNIIEFIRAPELLLWNKLNIVFALLFIAIVYLNNFHFNKKESNVI